MVVDMLLDGAGVEQDIARAIPLLFKVSSVISDVFRSAKFSASCFVLLFTRLQRMSIDLLSKRRGHSLLDEVAEESGTQ